MNCQPAMVKTFDNPTCALKWIAATGQKCQLSNHPSWFIVPMHVFCKTYGIASEGRQHGDKSVRRVLSASILSHPVLPDQSDTGQV